MDKRLEGNLPVYVQIMNCIREAIASGELAAGQRISSVRELAEEFGVNPNTMQRALTELEREGILVSERTQGRYVTSDRAAVLCLRKEIAEKAADSFIKDMGALGFTKEEMLDFFRQRIEIIEEKQVC